MRVVLFSVLGIAALAGALFLGTRYPNIFGNPRPPQTAVLFAQMDPKTSAAVRDTIIRNAVMDSFIVHVPLPDSCLKPNPPRPPCPPLLQAAKTDTIIR